MIRALLDTNILIDVMVKDRIGHDDAVELLGTIVSAEVGGCVCAASLKDLYYVSRRELADRKRRAWIRFFVRNLDVVSVDRAACLAALESDEPDFEDGLVRAIAEREGVDVIVTRDKGAFMSAGIPSADAGELLHSLSKECS